MSIGVDIQYVEDIGPQLNRFTKTATGSYRCRCPYCGDTLKSKWAQSAVFVRDATGDSLYYYCHRGCGSKSILQFLKDQFPNKVDEYLKDSFGDKWQLNEFDKKDNNNSSIDISEFSEYLIRLSDINEDHPLFFIKKYAINRHLPTTAFNELFATSNMFSLLGSIPKYQKKETFNNNHYSPALVFPFYVDREKTKIDAFQFRKLDDSIPKYLTIYLNDQPSVYYSKFIDRSKPIIATEGVVDKWMVSNSVMMMGVNKWKNLPKMLGVSVRQIILVFDNDFMVNSLVKEQMILAAKSGFSIFIPPIDIFTYESTIKDLNDYVIKLHKSKTDLEKFIMDNTYTGLTSVLKIQRL